MKFKPGYLFSILLMLPLLGVAGNSIYRGIEFNRNCGGYLIRASNANTVVLAKREVL